jgi:two-component system, chemotaxis family, CheB/CheR fusion protein
VTVTDIGTERKLRDEGTQLRLEATEAIETSHEPIVVADQNGRIRIANPAFGRLVGLPGHETARGTLFDLLPPDWDLSALRTLMERVQASGEKIDDTPVELAGTGDGRVFVSVRRVSNDAGAGTLLTFHVSRPPGEAPPSSAVVKKVRAVAPSGWGEGNADH